MEYFRFSRSPLFTALFSLMGLLLFPSTVQAASFSFTEFNIAFVLGLSLPILIIAGLMKPVVEIKWRFPALVTTSLLIMLYAIAYLASLQTMVLLSAAMLFLASVSLWPLNKVNHLAVTSTEQKTLHKSRCELSRIAIGGCAFIFIILLWRYTAGPNGTK